MSKVINNTFTKELKVARTCYDHIAGELGISITNYLLQENLLSESEKDFQLTEAGKSYFQRKLHIDTDELKKENGNFALNVWIGANVKIMSAELSAMLF